jgi:hypothetical protein
MSNNLDHLQYIEGITKADAKAVQINDKHYDASWKRRGGIGAYFVGIRKYDRMEAFAKSHGYDIFEAIRQDQRPEGIIDDIRDLRRYLLLWEAEAVNLGICPEEMEKNIEATPEPVVSTWTANAAALFPDVPVSKINEVTMEQRKEILTEAAMVMCDYCARDLPFIGVPRDGTSWTHKLEDYTAMCQARPIHTHIAKIMKVYEK